MIHAQFVINVGSFLYPEETPEKRVKEIEEDISRYLKREFTRVRIDAGPHEIVEENE